MYDVSILPQKSNIFVHYKLFFRQKILLLLFFTYIIFVSVFFVLFVARGMGRKRVKELRIWKWGGAATQGRGHIGHTAAGRWNFNKKDLFLFAKFFCVSKHFQKFIPFFYFSRQGCLYFNLPITYGVCIYRNL